MKAILETRCGCSRMIDIPGPPPPRDVRVPLKAEPLVVGMPLTNVHGQPIGNTDARTFKLFGQMPGQPIFLYREEG